MDIPEAGEPLDPQLTEPGGQSAPKPDAGAIPPAGDGDGDPEPELAHEIDDGEEDLGDDGELRPLVVRARPAPGPLPHDDPTAPNMLPPAPPITHPRGWRRWVLRLFIVGLLIAGAGTVAYAATRIVRGTDTASGRKATYGVLMPDDAHFRDIANQLLARKTPEKLRGITIVGADGKVTVIRYQQGAPSFLSSYLNPNALQVIARAIGVRSNDPITVDELRLEVLRRTGRQRWRLRGSQAGRPWRAVVNPNGTNLRLIPVTN